MIVTTDRYSPFRRRLSLLTVGCALALCGTALQAASIPQNLGNGLDKLLAYPAVAKSALGKSRPASSSYDGDVSEQAAVVASSAINDAQGRVLVRINPDGRKALADLGTALQGIAPSLKITAVDPAYRKVGVMNAYVSLDDVAALANAAGVRSVILELKPFHHKAALPASGAGNATTAQAEVPHAVPGNTFFKLGNAFDQGVTQHRIDQINRFYNPSAPVDYQGAGMSIGFISNSFAANNGNPTAATDVANFDLPGAATNPVNTQPVVVLQDDTTDSSSDDEGRGMVQIGFKMAPKAKLAFATADFGEVGFANNIRALAGIPEYMYPGQTFAADSICDDVGYYDEPLFQDGIIGQGVNDAAAFGVTYFSSAGNDIGINGYDSELRWVPNGTGLTAAAGNTALVNTNINLANVPTDLYAGGFHNFNPAAGQIDVAQTVNIQSNANEPPTNLQWNDPYDQNTTPDYVQPPIYTATGTVTNSTGVTLTVTTALTAGTLYEIDVNAATGSGLDSIVQVKDFNGNVVVPTQDTQIDEIVRFTAPLTGANYTITVTRYGSTTGAFDLTMYATNGFTGATITTDINLLAFRLDTGAYVPGSSCTSNNFATNQPIELCYTLRAGSQTQLQYVIARSNVPANGGPTRVRYTISGNGLSGLGPAEYFSYNAPTTGGHSMATGSNGVAAYSVFRPNLPESFTSPGPVRIYFDANGNPLSEPEIRQQPSIAAADAANITVSALAGDSSSDQDTNPNFSGTSAAAPHAAAIAALVLESRGGRHSVTPEQMKAILQSSTFPHDLDPSASGGTATVIGGAGGTVVVSIASDASANTATGSNDNNSIQVSYSGGSSITSLVFNPEGTAATAGNPTGGNNGVANIAGSSPAAVSYFENNYPGMVFMPATKAFTIGSKSTVLAASVAASYPNLAPAPSSGTQAWTMNLAISSGAFTADKLLAYNVGRGVQHSAVTGNTATIGAGSTVASYIADLLGGGVSIPSGMVVNDGMTFSGTTADGGTFSGVIRNNIGAGYSPVDGYGFINAEAAVGAGAGNDVIFKSGFDSTP